MGALAGGAIETRGELRDGAAQVEEQLRAAGETARVLDAMRRIVPEQRWGLGATDPPISFKGGWDRANRPTATTR